MGQELSQVMVKVFISAEVRVTTVNAFVNTVTIKICAVH